MKPLFEPTTLAKARPALGLSGSSSEPYLPLVAPAAVSAAIAPIQPPRITDLQISNAGADAVSEMAGITKKLLGHTRASDTGEFGKGLNSLVVLAKGLNPEDLKSRGMISRLLGTVSATKERFLAQYSTVEKQLNSLSDELDQKAVAHSSRILDLDQIYLSNFEAHQKMEAGIALCKAYLLELHESLANESQKAIGDSFGAQIMVDYQRLIVQAEQRIDELTRSMLLSKQVAPQIRMMQDDIRGLLQKFRMVTSVTIPAWINAFMRYIIQSENKRSVEILDNVDQITNEALRTSADLQRESSVQIAQSRNRSSISMETLSHVQTQLIGTVEAVMRIDTEARARRNAEATQLVAMERQLISVFVPGRR